MFLTAPTKRDILVCGHNFTSIVLKCLFGVGDWHNDRTVHTACTVHLLYLWSKCLACTGEGNQDTYETPLNMEWKFKNIFCCLSLLKLCIAKFSFQ